MLETLLASVLLLNEVNTMRANPAAYAAHLEQLLPFYKGEILRAPRRTPLRTKEGAAAVQEAIRALRSAQPLPRLRELPALRRAAEDHVNEIGPRGLVRHESLDGTRPADRVRRYMRGAVGVGEVISFGPEEARDVVIDLLVDDGVPGRGHRKLLLDERFRYGGAACGPHSVYRHMCVIDMLVPAGNMASEDAAEPVQP
ncbi:MAG TPA: CAP domain-containing protein [Bryobacteraceae bacterium]|nr:CAP domain-containing protein [Bryobacteraceae bacterium]